MKESDNVNHPAHYEAGYTTKIECIDIARHMPFCLGNAFKYAWRAGKKGGTEKAIEDLKKALWYLADDVENCCSDQIDLRTAKAIFELTSIQAEKLNPLESYRNNVLRMIIRRYYEPSKKEIGSWIRMFELLEKESK